MGKQCGNRGDHTDAHRIFFQKNRVKEIAGPQNISGALRGSHQHGKPDPVFLCKLFSNQDFLLSKDHDGALFGIIGYRVALKIGADIETGKQRGAAMVVCNDQIGVIVIGGDKPGIVVGKAVFLRLLPQHVQKMV